MTGALMGLNLLFIAVTAVLAFVWMRRAAQRSTRNRRAWWLILGYALFVLALWWGGLQLAEYPLRAALLVGLVVAALHVLFVGLMVWIAAHRPEPV